MEHSASLHAVGANIGPLITPFCSVRPDFTSQGSDKPLDADTLIPLLVHVLVHATLPRVHEALNFLRNFRGASWGGEPAYYVTCMCVSHGLPSFEALLFPGSPLGSTKTMTYAGTRDTRRLVVGVWGLNIYIYCEGAAIRENTYRGLAANAGEWVDHCGLGLSVLCGLPIWHAWCVLSCLTVTFSLFRCWRRCLRAARVVS